MKLSGWARIVVLVSATWVVGVCGVALYEWLHWAPTGENLNENQFFFNYYTESTVKAGFKPLIKVFNAKSFAGTMGWPLGLLWVSYFFISRGGRWVRKGFNQTPT